MRIEWENAIRFLVGYLTHDQLAKKHYYSPPSISNKKAFERYKNQPFELPSYRLMDYFTEHNFVERLVIAIKTKQNNFSRE